MTETTPAAWLWEKLAPKIIAKTAKGLWTGFKWAEAASKYCKNLYERYKTIQIFGLPEPVPLEGIFPMCAFWTNPRLSSATTCEL